MANGCKYAQYIKDNFKNFCFVVVLNERDIDIKYPISYYDVTKKQLYNDLVYLSSKIASYTGEYHGLLKISSGKLLFDADYGIQNNIFYYKYHDNYIVLTFNYNISHLLDKLLIFIKEEIEHQFMSYEKFKIFCDINLHNIKKWRSKLGVVLKLIVMNNHVYKGQWMPYHTLYNCDKNYIHLVHVEFRKTDSKHRVNKIFNLNDSFMFVSYKGRNVAIYDRELMEKIFNTFYLRI